MKILDGKKLSEMVITKMSKTAALFHRPPGLAFILIGANPASETYVRMKRKRCEEIGIFSKTLQFEEDISLKELLGQIDHLNRDPNIDGILIQQPLPKRFSGILETIDPRKDINGFHPINMGRLLLGENHGFIPCTPLGIQQLLAEYQIPLIGKHVVIVGRSNIVGKPLGALLMQKHPMANATVTLAHTATQNLEELTRTADILVAAIGSPHFIKAPMVKTGAVVIDVGINRYAGQIIGDVDFEKVSLITSYITPVPGGVGPMTIAMLMSNTLLSYERNI